MSVDLLHLPGDGECCDLDDGRRIGEKIDVVRALHLDARQFVSNAKLDPEIYLPGNVWANIDTPDRALTWPEWRINLVRCISAYSGFQLVVWARQDHSDQYNKSVVKAINTRLFGDSFNPTALDALLELHGITAKMSAERDSLIAQWESLVEHVPDIYRLRLPPVGGEMGVKHNGRILNPDLLSLQSRMNAIYASGSLVQVERAVMDRGKAEYLEIGPGCGLFAQALTQCFEGKLRAHLVDLPAALANATAYLSCASGLNNVSIVTPNKLSLRDKQFVLITNYLVPTYRQFLPKFELVHNAISMNEMTEGQVANYLDLIGDTLANSGVFHLSEGRKIVDYHVDALAAATSHFPYYTMYGGNSVEGVKVIAAPDSFFRLAPAPRRFK